MDGEGEVLSHRKRGEALKARAELRPLLDGRGRPSLHRIDSFAIHRRCLHCGTARLALRISSSASSLSPLAFRARTRARPLPRPQALRSQSNDCRSGALTHHSEDRRMGAWHHGEDGRKIRTLRNRRTTRGSGGHQQHRCRRERP